MVDLSKYECTPFCETFTVVDSPPKVATLLAEMSGMMECTLLLSVYKCIG